MSIRLLKPVTKASQRVLERLVAGLDVGDSKKFDNGGSFMAAHVEALQRTGAAAGQGELPGRLPQHFPHTPLPRIGRLAPRPGRIAASRALAACREGGFSASRRHSRQARNPQRAAVHA